MAAATWLSELERMLGLDRVAAEAGSAPGGKGDASGRERIRRIERRPSPYRTSALLEEIDVELDDGRRLELVLKEPDPGVLRDPPSGIKPAFLLDPAREIEVYRRILAPMRLGPALYGARADAAAGRFSLLIERVRGRELYQVGEIEAWEAAARWLAAFHLRLGGDGIDADALPDEARLVRYDRRFYLRWMERARQFAAAREGSAGAALEELAPTHGRVVDRLLELPTTVVHGEFYASNVLVAGRGKGGMWVVPVDWEMAGLGPGLVDLAALVAGSWPEPEKRRLALAYRREWIELGGAGWRDREVFLEAFACCRLHCAVQWLGWSPGWKPPREHRHDWLAEALRLAWKLRSRGGAGEAAAP